MCGISGIIHKANNQVNDKDIQAITDLIIHRGPDDYGYFYGENFAFGHRRLSIVDLSKAGHQPMHYMNKYTIVYNGEIYNYKEIKAELIKADYQFTSQTDTEVILAAYDKWGQECVHRFNGMWAFAIYDQEKHIIFCSRDRFGVKPFYYMNQGQRFVFGSEIKQCLYFCDRRIANASVLVDFLVFGYSEHSEKTFFQGIYSLLPGHNMTITLKPFDFAIENFYQLKQYDIQDDDAKIYDNYSDLFASSVKLRLRSDVKVGSCLSGGLDSSAIVSIAGQNVKDFNTFTAKSSDVNTDESHYASLVAKSIAAKQYIIEPQYEDFVCDVNNLAYVQEEPFASPSIYMQYAIFKVAKERGAKVLLDGQGGDETLLGYERYYPALLTNECWFKKIKLAHDISQNSKLSFLDIFKYYWYFTNARVRKNRKLKIFSPLVNAQCINYVKAANHYSVYANLYQNIFKLQNFDISSIQLPHLLRFEDKNAMFHSIETRLPFLDYRLLEFSINLPLQYKLHNGWSKYILRKTMSQKMPKEVVWRKNKFAFYAPEDSWYKKIAENAEILNLLCGSILLKEILQPELLTVEKMQQLPRAIFWQLLSIAFWGEVYKVSCINWTL